MPGIGPGGWLVGPSGDPVGPPGVHTASADLAIDATVRNLRHGDLGIDYVIAANVVDQVGTSITFDAAVNATAVGANLTFTAKVTKATKTKQVGASLTVRYRTLVNTHAGANLDLNFVVEPFTGKVGLDLAFDDEIQINNLAGVDLPFEYIVDFNPDQVRGDIELDATIAGLVGASLGIDATLAGRAGASLGLDAAIENRVGADLGIDAAIEASRVFYFTPVASAPRRGPERAPHAVRSDFGFAAPVRVLTGSALGIDAAVAALVGRILVADDRINRMVASNVTLDHKINDFYVVDADILLAAMIDPDILLGAGP